MNSISYFRQALAIDIILNSQTTKILLKIWEKSDTASSQIWDGREILVIGEVFKNAAS